MQNLRLSTAIMKKFRNKIKILSTHNFLYPKCPTYYFFDPRRRIVGWYCFQLVSVAVNQLVCDVTELCPTNCSCIKRPYNKSFDF